MIGIDIEENKRFVNWKEKEIKRVFAPKEIEYANEQNNKYVHLCGFFCIKEALVKALDDKTLKFASIEIDHSKSGKPYFVLNGYLGEIFKSKNISKADISISHTDQFSIAVVELN